MRVSTINAIIIMALAVVVCEATASSKVPRPERMPSPESALAPTLSVQVDRNSTRANSKTRRTPTPGERIEKSRIGVSACNKVSTPRFKGLDVKAEVSRAQISFAAEPGLAPYVELSKTPPTAMKDGCLGFPSGQSLGSWPVPRITEGGLFFLSFDKQTKIEPATKYYYVLNIPEVNVNINSRGNNERTQDFGQFTTKRQRVKIIFTRIYVLSDGDSESPGDLYFGFYANPYGNGQYQAYKFLGNARKRLSIESGRSIDIYEELVIDNAPDRLRIMVYGEDDDEGADDIFEDWGPGANYEFERAGPGKNQYGEWNFAKAEFDLSEDRYQAKKLSVPFNLRSVPLGPNTGDVVFDVNGRIEITHY